MKNQRHLEYLRDWAEYCTKKTTLVFTINEDNNPYAPKKEWYTIRRQKPGYNALVTSCLEYKVALAHLEGFISGSEICRKEIETR